MTGTADPPPKLVSLPSVSIQTGIPLDDLRRAKYELAALGLIERVGGHWIAHAADVPRIVDAMRKK